MQLWLQKATNIIRILCDYTVRQPAKQDMGIIPFTLMHLNVVLIAPGISLHVNLISLLTASPNDIHQISGVSILPWAGSRQEGAPSQLDLWAWVAVWVRAGGNVDYGACSWTELHLCTAEPGAHISWARGMQWCWTRQAAAQSWGYVVAWSHVQPHLSATARSCYVHVPGFALCEHTFMQPHAPALLTSQSFILPGSGTELEVCVVQLHATAQRHRVLSSQQRQGRAAAWNWGAVALPIA